MVFANNEITAAAHSKYAELLRQSQETDEAGRPTSKANQAKQKLKHPRMLSTHREKARRVAETAFLDQKAKAENAVVEALKQVVLADQKKAELDLYELDPEHADEHLHPTRQEHSQEGKDRLARPFVKAMIDRGVSTTALNRCRVFEHDAIAELLQWAHVDRQYENPDNPWRALAKAGFLHAYRDGMTADEARVVEAARMAREQPEDIELLLKAAGIGAIKLAVSPEYAAACLRIKKFSDEYAYGELSAVTDAHNSNIENDWKVIAEVLGLSDEDGSKVREVCRYIRFRQRADDFYESSKWDFALFQMKQVYDAHDIIDGHPHEWLPDFFDDLKALAEFLANRVESPQVLWEIISQAGRLSTAWARFEQVEESDRERRYREAKEESVREAEERGLPYKLNAFSYAVSAGEDGYEDIRSPEILPRSLCGPRSQDTSLSEDIDSEDLKTEPPSPDDDTPTTSVRVEQEILPPLEDDLLTRIQRNNPHEEKDFF